jgi:hypothetical protein
MSQSQLKTIENFVQFRNQLTRVAVVELARELRLIPEWGDRPLTAAELAERRGWDLRMTELLCFACCEIGLLERYEDDFAVPAFARLLTDDILVPRRWDPQMMESPQAMGSEDGPASPSLGHLPEETRLPDNWLHTAAAMDAAEALDLGRTRRGGRLLALGGSAALFAAAAAHRDPSCRITIADTAAGIAEAQKMLEGIGLPHQLAWRVWDYREPPESVPEFDLLIVPHLLNRIPRENAPEWIARWSSVVKPAGEIAIIDWFHGQAAGATTMVLWELEWACRNRGAELHSPPTIRGWMLDSGLSEIQFAFLPAPPHCWGLMLGHKAN